MLKMALEVGSFAYIRTLGDEGQALSAEAFLLSIEPETFGVLVPAAVTPNAPGVLPVQSVNPGVKVAVLPTRVKKAHASLEKFYGLPVCQFPVNPDMSIFLEEHGSTGSEKEDPTGVRWSKMIQQGLALEETVKQQGALLQTLIAQQSQSLGPLSEPAVPNLPELRGLIGKQGMSTGKAGSDSSENDSSSSEDHRASRRHKTQPQAKISARGALDMLGGMGYKGSSMTGEARPSGRPGPTGGIPTAIPGMQATLDSQSSGSLGTLINMEILKTLRGMQKKKGGSSDGDSDGEKNNQAFSGILSMRRRLKKKPRKVLRRFRSKVKDELGIMNEQMVWSYRDYAKLHRNTFGKMKGLWRMLHLLCETLELLDPEAATYAPEEGTALVAQSIKALIQVGLDGGDWTSASLLLPCPNPSGRTEFGGEESEMAAVHKYRKALKELKASGKLHDEDEGEKEKGAPQKAK